MQTLVFGRRLPRTVVTKLFGRLHPRFFVGALARTGLRAIPDPALRRGWVTIRTVLNPWLSCAPRGRTPGCTWCAV